MKHPQLINAAGSTELRISDLGRKLDDPGDAFYWLFLSTNRYSIHLRTWFEVTEVCLPEQAKMVNRFIREYNGLRGKGKIDADEFLKTLDLGPPDSRRQKDIADSVIAAIKDSVIAAIKKKAEKGREEGSYNSLVRDYGRGQLIVGLPLWFATLPSDPTDPTMVLKDFFMRLNLGFKAIKHPVLRANWCPFDSIVVLWNPTLAAIDEWAKVADPGVYSDPANYSLKNPLSFMKGYSFLKDLDFPIPNNIRLSARWDRYSSLNAMLAAQRRRLRLPNNPRPLGPKACLDIRKSAEVIESLRTDFYIWVLQLWLYVRGHGWGGLRRRIASKFSVRRLYTRLRLIFQAKKLYRSSFSNRYMKEHMTQQVNSLKTPIAWLIGILVAVIALIGIPLVVLTIMIGWQSVKDNSQEKINQELQEEIETLKQQRIVNP